jgi:hypothetical protein
VNDAETLCICRKESVVNKYDLTTIATLQNFFHKNTLDLKNVQVNKKRRKGEFTGCQN